MQDIIVFTDAQVQDIEKNIAIAFDGSLHSLTAIHFAFTNLLNHNDCATIITVLPSYLPSFDLFDLTNHPLRDLILKSTDLSALIHPRIHKFKKISFHDISHPDILAQARETAHDIRALIDALLSLDPDKKIQVNIKIGYGNPARVIKEIYRKDKYEYLLMGSRGHGGLDRLIFGSVSKSILDTTDIDVVIFTCR